MAAEWFCEMSGTTVGPLSSRQLKSLADEGRLARADRVKQGAQGQWVPAGLVQGLFAEEFAIDVNAPPKPPAKKAAAQPNVAVARKARQQRDFRLVVSLLVLVGGLTLLGVVVMLVGGWRAGPAETTAKQVRAAKQKAKAAEDLEDFNSMASARPVASEAAPPAAAAPDAGAAEWIDASSAAVQRGAAKVSITALNRGTPQGFRSRSGAVPTEPWLLIDVRVQNTSAKCKLDFRRFSSAGELLQRTKLTDNLGNNYRARLLARTRDSALASIYPNKDVEDQLVFEPPLDNVEYLRLELPASAFGEQGAVYFQIPTKMIAAASPEQPEPTAAATAEQEPPKPAAPPRETKPRPPAADETEKLDIVPPLPEEAEDGGKVQ